MNRYITALSFVAVLAAGCHGSSEDGDAPIPPDRQVVMRPESTLTATNASGTIVIKAGKGLNRCYTWEGETRCIEMWPREDWWMGTYGIYFPGPGEHWADHHGVTRGVLEESQRHYPTVDEAMKWLKSREPFPFVYRNDGLVVGWRKNLSRKQITVEVYQIVIGSLEAPQKPTSLPGANDAAITVAEATPQQP